MDGWEHIKSKRHSHSKNRRPTLAAGFKIERSHMIRMRLPKIKSGRLLSRLCTTPRQNKSQNAISFTKSEVEGQGDEDFDAVRNAATEFDIG